MFFFWKLFGVKNRVKNLVLKIWWNTLAGITRIKTGSGWFWRRFGEGIFGQDYWFRGFGIAFYYGFKLVFLEEVIFDFDFFDIWIISKHIFKKKIFFKKYLENFQFENQGTHQFDLFCTWTSVLRPFVKSGLLIGWIFIEVKFGQKSRSKV